MIVVAAEIEPAEFKPPLATFSEPLPVIVIDPPEVTVNPPAPIEEASKDRAAAFSRIVSRISFSARETQSSPAGICAARLPGLITISLLL